MPAQEWFYGFMTRPDIRIHMERKLHDMRMSGKIAGCCVPVAHVLHRLEWIRRCEAQSNSYSITVVKEKTVMWRRPSFFI